jgi:hypothetical protein
LVLVVLVLQNQIQLGAMALTLDSILLEVHQVMFGQLVGVGVALLVYLVLLVDQVVVAVVVPVDYPLTLKVVVLVILVVIHLLKEMRDQQVVDNTAAAVEVVLVVLLAYQAVKWVV